MVGKNPLHVGFKVTMSFFDAKAVLNPQQRKRRKMMSRFGAFVRTRSRSLLNKSGGKKNKVSAAGEPPRKHVGLLRKGVFFAFDRVKDSVVIGPIVLASAGGSSALSALEEGGIVTIDGFKDQKSKRVRIASRPFMGPAFADELPNISSIWKGA